ncbi:Gfo/Idh/MocA family oxidoreductase [uncultured Roseobacter sp.]|uniref:Gfo/Idh/MocA family protein n=1 Tax=uncultured Roseobacter sp. TaxID=114847 RepID=UPI00261CE3E0|nr:Gfo/Idh/MocA family oxidoreductase [uncultured Roseobacter sp.]
MTDKIKQGALVGCGFFARNHMHGWQDVPGAQIVAVCDLDQSKAEAFSRDFGGRRVFTDVQRMLSEMDLDFVDVATTPPSHRPLVECVAGSGVAVICQKPIADTYADAKAMVAAAETAEVPFFIHENFRWQKGIMAAKALIDQGQIGTLRFARFSFRHGYDNYVNQPYLAEIQRFALMDVGIHLYDVARHVMGEVQHVSCETQRRNPIVAGEDAFTSLLRHTNGGVSMVDCSFHSTIRPEPFPESLLWIEGDTGTVELRTDFTLTLHTEDGAETQDVEADVPRWGGRPWHVVQDSVINFQAHVVDVLNGKTHPQPSGADNLKTLALALASYDAMQSASVIDMKAWEARQS